MNIILFEPLEIGKPLSKRDERAVHLLKVLHKQVGDTFEAGIVGGNLGTGLIEGIRLDGIVFSLNLKEPPPPRLPICIGVGFPRPIQLRRLLRDLANLGVEAIDLLGTDLGEKSYRDTKLLTDGGAHAALVEGAVQARDSRIPLVLTYESIDGWLAERPWEKDRQSPYVDSGRDRNLRTSPILVATDNVRPEGSLSLLNPLGHPLVIAIGSERGWSDRERAGLESAGFIRLSMGKRALRTETACVAATVLAMEKLGELE
ncbi:MAG: 16S rRNA (uracil(1498)-N(3))-methyltransferase [Treponema sp.]|nr:16S rRNA (uracil(1498)-N(3))-methyltransferase [Treponema sp.]